MLLFLPIDCSQFLCKFHITQAWKRWVSRKENMVGEEKDETLRQYVNFCYFFFAHLPWDKISCFVHLINVSLYYKDKLNFMPPLSHCSKKKLQIKICFSLAVFWHIKCQYFDWVQISRIVQCYVCINQPFFTRYNFDMCYLRVVRKNRWH